MNVPTKWNPTTRIDTDPMVYDPPYSMIVDKKAALNTWRERALMLTVCKTWYPLAEELLYSELYIDSRARLIALSERISREKEDIWSPGWLTKTLHVTLSRHDKQRWFKINKSFPNLRALRIYHDQIELPTLSFLRRWAETLSKSSTRLTCVRWGDLWEYGRVFEVMKQFSSMISDLHLGATYLSESPGIQIGSFTHLRRLWLGKNMSPQSIRSFLEMAEFPCLEWLKMNDLFLTSTTNTPNTPDAITLLKRLGSQLRTLELVFYRNPPTSFEFLDAFPQLKSLILRIADAREPEDNILPLTAPHNALPHHLQALYIDLSPYGRSPDTLIRRWLPSFPHSHFPKLRRFFLLDSRNALIAPKGAHYVFFYSKECHDVLNSLSARLVFVE